MSFVQSAPQLADPYRDDRVLQSWLARVLPEAQRRAAEPDFMALADYAQHAYTRQATTTPAEPALTQWDVWGHRVDRIELTETWREGPSIAATRGLVADGHDRALGEFARVRQFAKVYLYHAASAFYSCPLAMTDGVATALRDASNAGLRERVLPHLLSRDPATFWISGQWMTETAGGSDVGMSETTARREADGTWRLNGRKWFTSAINAEFALALARPEGNPAGADGLALFGVETCNGDGSWNGIAIDRLKDKLGTRELPTAEIHLRDTRAELVGDTAHGVRAIAPVLQVTRLWNAFGSLSTMARCLALARDYARRRSAFGKPLIEQPLFADSLAGWEAGFEAAFHLAMEVALLLGRVESGAGDERDAALQRLLTPLAKLWICKLGGAHRFGNRRGDWRDRLSRGQRHSPAAARCAGVPDLGRREQRAGAGFPAGAGENRHGTPGGSGRQLAGNRRRRCRRPGRRGCPRRDPARGHMAARSRARWRHIAGRRVASGYDLRAQHRCRPAGAARRLDAAPSKRFGLSEGVAAILRTRTRSHHRSVLTPVPPRHNVARMERSGIRARVADNPDCGAARLHPGYEACIPRRAWNSAT